MSHEENSPSRSHIITRKTSFARTPGPRSIVRPRDRDQAETARRERKKERKKERARRLSDDISHEKTPRKRERETHIFPSSSSSPIPIASYKRTTHIGVKNKYGRRRRRTYQSQLHLSVEKEKAEPREEREERVRDHLSLFLSFSHSSSICGSRCNRFPPPPLVFSRLLSGPSI